MAKCIDANMTLWQCYIYENHTLCLYSQSARSQMAEAYVNKFAAGKFFAESAGLEPGNLNPSVVAVLKEDGIDIAGKKTNSVFDFLQQGKSYDYVVTVCDGASGERCPVFPGKAVTRLHWEFSDPSAFQGTAAEKLSFTRTVRDQIKAKMLQFIAENAQ
jgi:arsenate reductase